MTTTTERGSTTRSGEFISPDEVTQGFDSQGLNPFAYVLNGPTNHLDPTGEYILDGVSFGAWSSSTLESSNIQGRTPESDSSPSSTGQGVSYGSHLLMAPEFLAMLIGSEQSRPLSSAGTSALGDLSETGAEALAVSQLDGPEPGPADIVGVLFFYYAVLTQQRPGVMYARPGGNAAPKSAKSQKQLEKHVSGVKRAQARLKELKEELEKAKGPKRQQPIRERIKDLEESIKGHLKEIEDKWPGTTIPD